MKIAILQLGDMHFRTLDDLDSSKINKIVNAIREAGHIDQLIMLLVGDLTASGHSSEYIVVKKFIGELFKSLKRNKVYTDFVNIYCVPGNHDIEHTYNDDIDIEKLNMMYRNNSYEENINKEIEKLNNFYEFAKFDDCFIDNKMIDRKILEFFGYKISINLINTALFSLKDVESKGLGYLRDSDIENVAVEDEDFSIAVMHHDTDKFIDTVKRILDDSLCKNVNICCNGHVHNSDNKKVIKNSSGVMYQTSGALCENGEWENSSFNLDVIDTETNECKILEFKWDKQEEIYKQISQNNYQICKKEHRKLEIRNDYLEELLKNEKFISESSFLNNYVMPRLSEENSESSNDVVITKFEDLTDYIENNRKIAIFSDNSSGKSALLKYLFLRLSKTKTVILCDINCINTKSIQNVVEETFYEIYGNKHSNDYLKQLDINEKVIIIDDADRIKDKKIGNLIEYLSDFFGTIIISSNGNIDFDIVERIKQASYDKQSYSKLSILPFFEDKRLELIKNVLSLNNIDSIENEAELINDYLKLQRKYVLLTAPFIIDFTNYYCTHKNDISQSDSSIFSKVFEANLTIRISKCIKREMTVEKVFSIFSELAYYAHQNKSNYLSDSNIEEVITEYNEYHGDDVTQHDIVEIGKETGIFIYNNNRKGYRFVNNSCHSYYVAKKINAKFKTDGNEDDIRNIVNNLCTEINEDILMFLIYITDDIKILELLYKMANDFTKDWEELDFRNLPEYMNRKMDYQNPLLETKEIRIESNTEKEKSSLEIEVKEMYDDVDIESEINKLIRATSLLEMLSKSLPSFEHAMSKDLKEKIVSVIYKLPNQIINYWMNYVDKEFYSILSEYLAQKGTFEFLDEKRKAIENLDIFIKNVSSTLLLEIYDLAFSRSTKPNTYKYLEQFNHNEKDSYKIEYLLYLCKAKKFESFTNLALSYSNDFTYYFPQYLTKRIVYYAMPRLEGHPKERAKLMDNFIEDKKRTKEINNDILSKQISYKKK